MRIVLFEHAKARARRSDHIIVGLELLDDLFSDALGLELSATVVGRLTTAGLQRRHIDLTAGALQQLDCGKTYVRPKQIDQTSCEQAHARLGGVSAHWARSKTEF